MALAYAAGSIVLLLAIPEAGELRLRSGLNLSPGVLGFFSLLMLAVAVLYVVFACASMWSPYQAKSNLSRARTRLAVAEYYSLRQAGATLGLFAVSMLAVAMGTQVDWIRSVSMAALLLSVFLAAAALWQAELRSVRVGFATDRSKRFGPAVAFGFVVATILLMVYVRIEFPAYTYEAASLAAGAIMVFVAVLFAVGPLVLRNK